MKVSVTICALQDRSGFCAGKEKIDAVIFHVIPSENEQGYITRSGTLKNAKR